jgi:23S rRNA pseudouridine955/2504/2580 synthase
VPEDAAVARVNSDKSSTYGLNVTLRSIRTKLPAPATPGAATAVQWLTVDAESAGQRLDNVLLRLLKGVPKTHIYRVIRSGEVRLNKGRVQADSRVAEGDVLRLPPMRLAAQPDEPQAASAPPREFPVLLEDEHLLAIDKPAGLAVHGGSGVAFGLIEQLRMARPADPFMELVHRLDRETSGVLLVARKRLALKRLQEQFRERGTDKIYLALVRGHWPENLKVIDQSLLKTELDDGQKQVRIVPKDHPQAMRAITLVQVRARLERPDLGALTLLQVTIRTGRTHQIRVHLAGAGHPIAGDDKYGDFVFNRQLQKMTPPALSRMFLHAWQLSFDHPAERRRLSLQSQLPADLQAFIDHVPTP